MLPSQGSGCLPRPCSISVGIKSLSCSAFTCRLTVRLPDQSIVFPLQAASTSTGDGMSPPLEQPRKQSRMMLPGVVSEIVIVVYSKTRESSLCGCVALVSGKGRA